MSETAQNIADLARGSIVPVTKATANLSLLTGIKFKHFLDDYMNDETASKFGYDAYMKIINSVVTQGLKDCDSDNPLKDKTPLQILKYLICNESKQKFDDSFYQSLCGLLNNTKRYIAMDKVLFDKQKKAAADAIQHYAIGSTAINTAADIAVAVGKANTGAAALAAKQASTGVSSASTGHVPLQQQAQTNPIAALGLSTYQGALTSGLTLGIVETGLWMFGKMKKEIPEEKQKAFDAESDKVTKLLIQIREIESKRLSDFQQANDENRECMNESIITLQRKIYDGITEGLQTINFQFNGEKKLPIKNNYVSEFNMNQTNPAENKFVWGKNSTLKNFVDDESNHLCRDIITMRDQTNYNAQLEIKRLSKILHDRLKILKQSITGVGSFTNDIDNLLHDVTEVINAEVSEPIPIPEERPIYAQTNLADPDVLSAQLNESMRRIQNAQSKQQATMTSRGYGGKKTKHLRKKRMPKKKTQNKKNNKKRTHRRRR